MPQSKQMKLQWLTIDGRNVPFALPQHWNGDDWTITGADNPLPIANYIEKNGIMVPVSENNPVPTQLTGSNVEQVINRGIYTSHQSKSFDVPFGAKGFVATMTAYARTGTFESGDTVTLRYREESLGANFQFGTKAGTPAFQSGMKHQIYLYPGIEEITGAVDSYSGNSRLFVNGVLGTRIAIQTLLGGTFESGQGYDLEVVLKWLY